MLLAGCRGCGDEPLPEALPEDAEEAVLELPPPMSPGTLAALGSHVWEATLEQKGDPDGRYPTLDIAARMVWAELDVYEYEQIDAGEVRVQERRIDADKYRRTSAEAPWVKTLGPSGDSMVLYKTTLMWTQAMQPFDDLAAWERLADEVIAARPVRVYRVSLGAPAAPDSALPVDPDAAQRRAGRSTTPVALEGRVYVDVETGNRILAELDGRFVPFDAATGHDLTDEVLVTYRESRSITPLPPDVVAPRPERVVDRTRPGPRQYRLPPGVKPPKGDR